MLIYLKMVYVLLWVDLCVHICYSHFCEHAINLEQTGLNSGLWKWYMLVLNFSQVLYPSHLEKCINNCTSRSFFTHIELFLFLLLYTNTTTIGERKFDKTNKTVEMIIHNEHIHYRGMWEYCKVSVYSRVAKWWVQLK